MKHINQNEAYLNLANQSKANQSKANQNKADQSKTAQKTTNQNPSNPTSPYTPAPNYFKTAELRMQELQQMANVAEKRIAMAPSGSLDVCKGDGKVRYYWVEGGQRSYLDQKQQKTIKALAQKSYDKKVVQAAREEWSYWSQLKRFYTKGKNPESILFSLNQERHRWITAIADSDEEFVANWIKKGQLANRDHSDESWRSRGDAVFLTENGEQVRSKSEVIIANALKNAGVPYLYEQPLELVNTFGRKRTVYPDFTVLNVNTRKEYYWEHFGLMGNAEYQKSMFQKISDYRVSGFLESGQLIATFENDELPLSQYEIKNIIQMLKEG